MLKEALVSHAPNLNEILRGNIEEIAVATGLHAQTVGRMLRGKEEYSDATVIEVLSEAKKIMQRRQEQFTIYIELVDQLISVPTK